MIKCSSFLPARLIPFPFFFPFPFPFSVSFSLIFFVFLLFLSVSCSIHSIVSTHSHPFTSSKMVQRVFPICSPRVRAERVTGRRDGNSRSFEGHGKERGHSPVVGRPRHRTETVSRLKDNHGGGWDFLGTNVACTSAPSRPHWNLYVNFPRKAQRGQYFF